MHDTLKNSNFSIPWPYLPDAIWSVMHESDIVQTKGIKKLN